MSLTKKQKEQFAKTILNHDALDYFLEAVQKRLFDRFKIASHDERVIINCIMDNQSLFMAELKAVVAQMDDEKPVNTDDNNR